MHATSRGRMLGHHLENWMPRLDGIDKRHVNTSCWPTKVIFVHHRWTCHMALLVSINYVHGCIALPLRKSRTIGNRRAALDIIDVNVLYDAAPVSKEVVIRRRVRNVPVQSLPSLGV